MITSLRSVCHARWPMMCRLFKRCLTSCCPRRSKWAKRNLKRSHSWPTKAATKGHLPIGMSRSGLSDFANSDMHLPTRSCVPTFRWNACSTVCFLCAIDCLASRLKLPTERHLSGTRTCRTSKFSMRQAIRLRRSILIPIPDRRTSEAERGWTTVLVVKSTLTRRDYRLHI